MHEDAGREWTLEELSGTAEDRARIEREAREADLTLLRWLHAEAAHGLMLAVNRVIDLEERVSGQSEVIQDLEMELDKMAAFAGSQSNARRELDTEVWRLRREVEFEAKALETHGEWFGVDEPERVCACISDDQAAQLAEAGTLPSGRPAFTRPVCAVHPEPAPADPATGWCNCQAIPGTVNYPGPWHPVGNSGGYCARTAGTPWTEGGATSP